MNKAELELICTDPEPSRPVRHVKCPKVELERIKRIIRESVCVALIIDDRVLSVAIRNQSQFTDTFHNSIGYNVSE